MMAVDCAGRVHIQMQTRIERQLSTQDDIPFLLSLRRETMDVHLAASGASTTDESHLARVMHHFDCAEVLVSNGDRVGLFKVLRSGREWEILQIQLHSRLQGQGLGRSLLEELMAEAAVAGVDIKLDVLKANPARRLYERLGFTRIAEDVHEFRMVFRAHSANSQLIGAPPERLNVLLLAGGTLSVIAAVLHLACIAFGPAWYRFFGAGEQMVQLAASGSLYPAVVTSLIASVLLVWALFAFSAAGLVRKLPLLRTALSAITAVYLIRGVAVLPFIAYLPGRSVAFWWWSSAICLMIGLVHLAGLVQVWRRLGQLAT